MRIHLPRLDGWGQAPPVKNGLALSGYGAAAMNARLGRISGAAARATASDLDLGSRQRVIGVTGACPILLRHRHEGIRRRHALALAATHE